MAVLPIRIYGDPVLRERAHEIDPGAIDDGLRAFSQGMIETMYDARGIGLAANQVGDLRRILVIDVADAEERPPGKQRPAAKTRAPEVYINPVILDESIEDGPYNEGCLSIPEVEGDVYRPLRIRLRWLDLDGEQHEAEVDDLRARVLQHEIDHLDGVLFVDHMPTAERAKIAGKLNLLKEATTAG